MSVVKSIIEKFLDGKHNPKGRKPSTNYSLSPSMMGDDCLRKKYFSYFKIPQAPKNLDGILIMESGIGVHDQVQGWLKDVGVAVDYVDPKTGKPPINFGKVDIEFPISIPELLIQKGKIDRIIVLGSEIWIVEIKSVGGRKFTELQEPQFDHTIQGMVYVFGFEKCLAQGDYNHVEKLPKGLPVRGVKLIYVNRDNGQMKEFSLERDEDLFVQICKDVSELSKYILSKELPPPPAGGLCKYCPYPEYCKNNRNVD